MELIDKAAAFAEIEKRIGNCAKQREDMLNVQCYTLADDASARIGELNCIKDFLDTLEVKEVDVSNLSENLAEAYEYLDYMSTGNLAHNKPMVAARLKKAIQGLYNAGLLKLTHDEKYRMENLGLKAQKGE